MALQVTDSPFNEEQTDLLNRLIPTLSETQKIWLSGYLASPAPQTATAFAETAAVAMEHPPETATLTQTESQPKTQEVTILYGSETGNCQEVAEDLYGKLESQPCNVTLASMLNVKPKNLKNADHILVVVATHGEGDPPEPGLSFYETMNSRKAPKLDGVHFSVLSLGDLSYEYFCQAGKDIDQRLEELGGERLYPRVDCDVDFDEDAEGWIDGVLAELSKYAEGPANNDGSAMDAPLAQPTPAKEAYSRKNPFRAEILENINISGRGSNKENRHLELSLEDSNLEFEPGDSLGIFPENDATLVEQLIECMNWEPEALVTVNKQGEKAALREALTSHFEITVLTKPLMQQAAELSSREELKDLLADGNEDKLRDYMTGRDLLDLAQDFGPWEIDAEAFIKILRKIPARLYSIANSYHANPDEVHLTIGTVRYETHGRARTGVCSGQCAERTEPGEELPVYVHRNPNFKLPEDPQTPIIMIGPGTGVAPFRSFLEEREEIEAEGKTWLFFGEQHFSSDFLYQVDWQQWLKDGVLTKMDVAFSRDGEEKVYVQHRMRENAREFYQWLQEGAVLYVCGDEKQMASDVHDTLSAILQQEGGLSEEEATAYIEDMKLQNRYQRDVY
ncbi:assimilatory sulfite reductase (NADPH) flavoprotein subunit [Salicibibacter cibarius]|uniref:assimilatory sulfite reductase (NADPH) n=1 Tax=Salicibibacter cibarius TaxID=2743000 RepID=A0A7T6Z6F0_9BACI|nr:assimilatory sulfite reductase (NADPH) flavoprotein subunit [Salicibibacter cibarius]QQK77663.1 assimilatory sulfite reductase (NADPH) flavoprotein subunit [Salicibibacter cibarius]